MVHGKRDPARILAIALSVFPAAGLLPGSSGAPPAARPPAARGWTVTTVAGGVGGPAPAASVSIGNPCGLTWSAGHLLIGTSILGLGDVVRSESDRTGWLADPLGAGLSGFSPDGTLARGARLTQACDVARDIQGNLVFSDSSDVNPGYLSRYGNDVVRVLAASSGILYGRRMTVGRIYTIAGNGTFGNTGDGGPATAAELGIPVGLAIDSAGNVVIGTAYPTGRIRVVAEATGTFYGRRMQQGDIYTIAGGGTSGCATGTSHGLPATSATLGLTSLNVKRNQLAFPSGLRIDHAGNIVFTDVGCGGIVRVLAASDGVFYGRRMTLGRVYTIAGGGTADPGNGGPATSARLKQVGGLAVDHAGNIVIAETGGLSVRLVAVRTGLFYGQPMRAGHIYTLAGGNGSGQGGDGGPAVRARLHDPAAVAVDGNGNIAIADWANGRVRLIAARSGSFYGRTMHAGDIYTIAGNGAIAFSGDGGPATSARFEYFSLNTVAADRAGDLLVVDGGNGRVRLVPARTRVLFGRHMRAGDVYTIAGGPMTFGTNHGCPAAEVRSFGLEPCYAAFDHAGNAVVSTPRYIKVIAAHSGRYYGQQMQAGHIYLIAGGGSSIASGVLATSAKLDPAGLVVDSHGNVLTNSDTTSPLTLGPRERVVAAVSGTFYGLPMRAGRVYSIGRCGGVFAADHHGNAVLIHGDVVLVLAGQDGTFYGQAMTAGHCYRVAGDGSTLNSGDGGPALSAGLSPEDVAVDAVGNLVVVSDGAWPQSVIRVVAASTGTFYGQRMTGGDIYTVAGGGGSLADDAPALRADFDGGAAVAASPAGIVVSLSWIGRIMLVHQ